MKTQEIKEHITKLELNEIIELESWLHEVRIKHEGVPASQFHYYCDPKGIPILRDEEIKLSDPMLVNDPFEFLPQGSSENGISHWRKMREYVARPWYFLSISHQPNNVRMWAQYGKEHTGLMLTLDFEKGPLLRLHEEAKALMPVDYHTPERVDIFGKSDKRILSGADIRKLVSSKGNDWAHEGEWRVLIYKENCFTGPTPKNEDHFAQLRDINGHMTAFLKVPHECVQKVTVGLESQTSLVEQILEIKKAKQAHWKVTRLKISPTRYEFEEELIES